MTSLHYVTQYNIEHDKIDLPFRFLNYLTFGVFCFVVTHLYSVNYASLKQESDAVAGKTA